MKAKPGKDIFLHQIPCPLCGERRLNYQQIVQAKLNYSLVLDEDSRLDPRQLGELNERNSKITRREVSCGGCEFRLTREGEIRGFLMERDERFRRAKQSLRAINAAQAKPAKQDEGKES